LKKGIQKNLYI